jgi:hypothetical protein
VIAEPSTETDRIRRIYEKEAPKYDRQMRFFDRALFTGGREWVCSQAQGDVLEIAVGTGRNLRHYPDGVKLTGIEFSPEMLDIAHTAAADVGRSIDLRVATPRRSSSPTKVSTPSSAPWRCARSPTIGTPSPKPTACCDPEGVFYCSSTSAAPTRRSGSPSAGSTRSPCASKATTYSENHSTTFTPKDSKSSS